MKEEKTSLINTLVTKFNDAAYNKEIECELKTSERVLKRVTDGIYRQPSSALRELIANAYDADASLVEIQTDQPRFNRIIIRDNGNGLTPESLFYLTQSIGGSSKRTITGINMGICDPIDPKKSPGGRKLIGKIGIGLFSVSQLTKEFQIITKTKGANFRTIADVVLHTYSEDVTNDPDQEFKTGTVKIWKVPASDVENHGTEVILRNLLQKTKDDLTSKVTWYNCNPRNFEGMKDITSAPGEPPHYHIGCVKEDSPDEIDKTPNLPWEYKDDPEERFKKLIEGMNNLRGKETKNPSIYDHLDYYLRMIWILSLSAPLDYIDGHPFDIKKEDNIHIFELGNNVKSQANDLVLKPNETIRKKLSLVSPERGSNKVFRVIIDGVELFRPIKFRNSSQDTKPEHQPLLFIGKDKPDLSQFPIEVRGGELEFEAYLLWNHTVVPKEHAGVLVRINDSNGVFFDNTFMDYPVSEQTRKKQITAEIFVTRGLDAALNIDRESFNYSHPHYQYLRHWIHNAFRQFSNKQKGLAKEIRDKINIKQITQEIDELDKKVEESLSNVLDGDTPIPSVEFIEDEKVQEEKRMAGVLAFRKDKVFKTPIKSLSEKKFEAQIKALAKILDGYGVFENMPYEKQQKLLHDIVTIFS